MSETNLLIGNMLQSIHYLASGMGSTIYNHMWGADASATGEQVLKRMAGRTDF
ncbi:MAG: hypothetical protein ACLUVO_07665 [Roseburia sp.]